MTHLTNEYEVEVREGSLTPLEVGAGKRPALLGGPPPEFGGNDTWWSPEHLLVSATATCFAATFFGYLKASHLHVAGFHCRAKGILGLGGSGFTFTSIQLFVEMRALGDEIGLVQAIVERAKMQCYVANSLRCPVTVSAEIRPS